MTRLPHYTSQINHIIVDGAVNIIDCSFHLRSKELYLIKKLIEKLKSLGELDYFTIKEAVASYKKDCGSDFNNYMKGIYQFSDINKDLLKEVVLRPVGKERDQLVHTICRLGEFFYFSDEEMESLTQDMNLFIELGDCKLFDYEGAPYKDGYLTGDLVSDIHKFSGSIADYLHDKGLELDPNKVLKAIELIEKWNRSPIDHIPYQFRGYFKLFQKIRNASRKLNSVFDEGMPTKYMMSKLSGSCLNKEPQFRNFREKSKTVAWKNPETNCFLGNTNVKIPLRVKDQLFKIAWWNMDAIYYSLGKGPWLKARYVGQPAALFQNLCEPGASVVKECILNYHLDYIEGREEYSAEGINIYDNEKRLLELINRNCDFNSIDYSSYSDYLNRDCFSWIMRNWFGFPDWYNDLVMSIMGLPVKVNGQVYENRHASVMGIKINFLLISFANLLMWMISNIISNIEDEVIIMGDDRETGSRIPYEENHINTSLAVAAYFNCVSNMDKCEWMLRDGYSSFCKRYFNRNKEDISGLGGEYVLKAKPFILDISNWMNLCQKKEISINQEDQRKWIKYWLPYISLTYHRFYKDGDPKLEDLFEVQKKIPHLYGGLSFEEPDDAIDKIMMRSLLAAINTILEYAGEDLEDERRKKIRNWLKHHLPLGSPYIEVLYRASSFDKDWDKIREAIEIIERTLTGRSSSEEVREARYLSQRLTEIVLQRDSRLASSTSTKNRIDYAYDQDKISKIRKIYLDACLTDQDFLVESNLVDHSVFNELMEKMPDKAIPEYLTYLNKKTKTKSGLEVYYSYTSSFLAMKIFRDDKTFYKRLESEDSSYKHAYQDSDGRWHGVFLNYEDLTEEEKQVYSYYRSGSTRKVIQQLDEALNSEIKDMQSYLLNRLAELYV